MSYSYFLLLGFDEFLYNPSQARIRRNRNVVMFVEHGSMLKWCFRICTCCIPIRVRQSRSVSGSIDLALSEFHSSHLSFRSCRHAINQWSDLQFWSHPFSLVFNIILLWPASLYKQWVSPALLDRVEFLRISCYPYFPVYNSAIPHFFNSLESRSEWGSMMPLPTWISALHALQLLVNSRELRSSDSGFAESRTVISAKVRAISPVPIGDLVSMSSQTLPQDLPNRIIYPPMALQGLESKQGRFLRDFTVGASILLTRLGRHKRQWQSFALALMVLTSSNTNRSPSTRHLLT